MDIDIIKEVVKDRTTFWNNDEDIHFIIYDRLFIRAFDNYQDFEEYVLGDDFMVENMDDPNIAVIGSHFGEHRVISSHRIKTRHNYMQKKDNNNG